MPRTHGFLGRNLHEPVTFGARIVSMTVLSHFETMCSKAGI